MGAGSMSDLGQPFVSPDPDGGRGVALGLFCGVGGLDYGIEGAGFDIVGGVDHEQGNVESHRLNFGYGTSVVGDLAEMHADDIRRRCGLRKTEIDLLGMGESPTAPGTLTLLAGGPPCQGFSSMGKRDADDPRSALLGRFADYIVQLQPRYALAENVPGLVSNPAFAPHLDNFLEKLERGGFSVVDPKVLNAADYGVPQSRSRVIFMIYRRGERAPLHPEPTHGVDDLLLSPTPRVIDALGDLPEASDFPELWETDATRLPASAWGAPSPYAMAMRGLSNDPDDLSYRRRWDPCELTASQLTRHDPARVEIYRKAPAGKLIPKDKLVKLDAFGLAPTLRAGSGSFTAARPVHHAMGRVITVREACRLHSIPDWFIPSPTKIRGIRQVGNSVPPLMARAVAHEIRKAAGIKAQKPSVMIEAPKQFLTRSADAA